MGRPKKTIDPEEVEKVYSLQCTDAEAATFLGVSGRTIARRRKEKKFAEAIERGLAKGKLSVRRQLFRQSANGNIAATIFLAKNVLGYRDVVANEHSGPNGSAIEVSNRPNLIHLNEEELRQLRTIALKTQPNQGGQPGTGDAQLA